MRFFFTTIAKVLFLILILGIDAGFLPGLGGGWNTLNAAFILSIFFAFIFRTSIAYIFYFASTFLIAFTAGDLFLIPLTAGFLSIFTITMLLERFFTNRSYYVLLAVGTIAWILYHLIYGVLVFSYHSIFPEIIIKPISLDWLSQVLTSTFFVLLILSIGYLAVNFMSKRFRSYFIISDY